VSHGTTTAAEPSVARPLRADAARNREKLLAAAGDAFAEQGTEASLEEIAREAGVGVGTLYRHFPTRAALVEEVYRSSADELCAAADTLLAQYPPDEALERWVLGFVGYVARKRGMASALKAALGPESATIFQTVRGKFEETAGKLIAAAQEQGAVRRDVEPADVMRAVSGVCLAQAEAHDSERAVRVLHLVLDGLRYGAEG
jgi:AcrR family transcriptional regulator